MTRYSQRVFRRALFTACAVLLGALAPPLGAAECSISATPVGFGVYDVFAANPNNNGVGSLRIICSGNAGDVLLSTGQSNGYGSRVMKSGANSLNYNLYTSAARNVVWGDGSGGSSLMRAAEKATTTFNVYGQISAGQDAAVGIYTDSIIVTMHF